MAVGGCQSSPRMHMNTWTWNRYLSIHTYTRMCMCLCVWGCLPPSILISEPSPLLYTFNFLLSMLTFGTTFASEAQKCKTGLSFGVPEWVFFSPESTARTSLWVASGERSGEMKNWANLHTYVHIRTRTRTGTEMCACQNNYIMKIIISIYFHLNTDAENRVLTHSIHHFIPGPVYRSTLFYFTIRQVSMCTHPRHSLKQFMPPWPVHALLRFPHAYLSSASSRNSWLTSRW